MSRFHREHTDDVRQNTYRGRGSSRGGRWRGSGRDDRRDDRPRGRGSGNYRGDNRNSKPGVRVFTETGLVRQSAHPPSRGDTSSMSPMIREIVSELSRMSVMFPYKRLFSTRETVIKSFVSLMAFSRDFDRGFDYRGYLIETDLRPTVPMRFVKDLSPTKNIVSSFTHFTKTYEDYTTRDWMVDYFIEDSRMLAYRPHQGKSTSPHDEWYTYGSYVEKAVDHALKNLPVKDFVTFVSNVSNRDSETLFQLREGLYMQRDVQECPNESPSFLKCLFEHLGIKENEGTVFDGAAGWGDKLLGCLAIGCKRYLGVDPNLNSTAGFREMVELFGKVRHPDLTLQQLHLRYGILPLAMPDCKLPAEEGTFDISFLSPPSFDSEVYSTDSGQSVNIFSDKALWREKFLYPTLARCFRMLKEGGYLIVQSILIGEIEPYVTNYMNLDGTNDVGPYVPVFLGPIAVTDAQTNPLKRNRFKPMWIWQKVRVESEVTKVSIDGVKLSKTHRFNAPRLDMLDLQYYYRKCQYPGPFDWDAKCAVGHRLGIAKVMEELMSITPYVAHIMCTSTIHREYISILRAFVWSASGTQVSFPYRYQDVIDHASSAQQWLDDEESDSVHIYVEGPSGMDVPGEYEYAQFPIIASVRVRIKETASEVSALKWLLKDKDALRNLKGPVASIEKLVVHPFFQRTVVDGEVLGGGLGKFLDIYCINYARVTGCRYVFCDVPPYRVAGLKEMGFSNELFTTKSSYQSKTPEIEWTGMLLDLYRLPKGKDNLYIRTSAFSTYVTTLSNRVARTISPRRPYTYLISGNSGLMKGALRFVLEKNYLEFREVTKDYKYPIDFVSLEWNYGYGKIDKEVQAIKCRVRNILDDRKDVICDKRRLYESFVSLGAEERMCDTALVEDVHEVTKPLIVRPVGGLACGGRDIHVVTTLQELRDVEHELRKNKRYTSIIASEYIEKPLLFVSRKMHVRMYCLVRSPSEKVDYGCFMFDIGKILTAELYYPYNVGDWDNKKIHDTHAGSTKCNLWFPHDMNKELPRSTNDELVDQMRDICTYIGKAMRGNTFPYPESDNAYEVFGCDFMITTPDFKVKLLEVNTKTEFTTICEPYEAEDTENVNYPMVKDGDSYRTQYERREENTNLVGTTKTEHKIHEQTKQYPLTFGYFSWAMYRWISHNGIIPYL